MKMPHGETFQPEFLDDARTRGVVVSAVEEATGTVSVADLLRSAIASADPKILQPLSAALRSLWSRQVPLVGTAARPWATRKNESK